MKNEEFNLNKNLIDNFLMHNLYVGQIMLQKILKLP